MSQGPKPRVNNERLLLRTLLYVLLAWFALACVLGVLGAALSGARDDSAGLRFAVDSVGLAVCAAGLAASAGPKHRDQGRP